MESSTENGTKTININISENTDPTFMAAELSLAILDLTKGKDLDKDEKSDDEEEVEMTKQELLIYKLTSYYSILGELNEEETKGIFWEFYIPKFYKLAESDHMEAFCYFKSCHNSHISAIIVHLPQF